VFGIESAIPFSSMALAMIEKKQDHFELRVENPQTISNIFKLYHMKGIPVPLVVGASKEMLQNGEQVSGGLCDVFRTSLGAFVSRNCFPYLVAFIACSSAFVKGLL
jgi:hypothetical protein